MSAEDKKRNVNEKMSELHLCRTCANEGEKCLVIRIRNVDGIITVCDGYTR